MICWIFQRKNNNNNSYFLPWSHWDSRYMAWHGHKADTRDRQANHHSDGRQQGNSIPVPTPVRGSPERECGLLPKHHCHWMKRRCNHWHTVFIFQFSYLWLCTGRPKNNNNNEAFVYSAIVSGAIDGHWSHATCSLHIMFQIQALLDAEKYCAEVLHYYSPNHPLK